MVVNLSAICNYPELLIALKSMDISVPARTNGRKTHHAESWTICRMLSTLGDCGHLDYPLSLKHRDRPDFLLQSGAVEIGIEATEAVSEQYAAYSALAEREFPEALREPAHFKLGAPKRTLKEMREILRRGKLTAEPWAGDQPEKEWATYMANVVETKTEKMRKAEFTKFTSNWLAVYDNLPLPNIHLGDAIKVLIPMLRDHWHSASAFDYIFIEHGPVIARIAPTTKNHMHLNDIW